MTSTYDSLAGLAYEVLTNNPQIKNLVTVVFDYAIGEINKVNPKILHWDTWTELKSGGLEFFKRLYGEEDASFRQKADFISRSHGALDHNTKYHLTTVNRKLDFIIGRLCDWFVRYKDREEFYDRFAFFAEFNKPTRDRYPKVFKELKHLVDIGVIEIPKTEKRTLRKVAKW